MATRGTPIPGFLVRSIQRFVPILGIKGTARHLQLGKNTVKKYRPNSNLKRSLEVGPRSVPQL
jgi:hypothetical protein